MASTYLTRTFSSPTNRKKFTLSMWVKLSGKGSGNNNALLVCGTSGGDEATISFGNDALTWTEYKPGSGTVAYLATNRQFRDYNSWYHLVFSWDTTLSTADDRMKIYVNGVQETSFSSRTNPSQNYDAHLNTNIVHEIGRQTWNSSGLFNGSMSHIHFCDGYTYQASDFGETDTTTGEWKINTSPSVSYGTNGFWILKDGNSVTDQSGNSNNFTVGGGTLTKTEDNPSNVFATCSKEPIRTVSGTQLIPVLSNGNTTWDATGVSGGASVTLSTLGATTGKYYMEAKVGGSYAGHSRIGVGTFEGYDGTTFFNSTSSNYAAYTSNGEKNIAGTTSSYGASYTAGDIISVALDCDNNTVTFYKNGASQGAISITNNDNFKHFSCGGYDATGSNITNWICNFGNGYFGTTAVSSAGTNASNNGIFEYDVPTGFTALSTKGLNT